MKGSKKMKKVTIGIIMGVFTIGLITGCGCSKKEEQQEDIKINNNEGVIKDQTVEVFELKNTSLIYENGNTTLETVVTNTSSKDEYLEEFKIKVTDASGNEMITLTGFVGEVIKAGESKVINSYCGEDLSTATNITYTVIR